MKDQPVAGSILVAQENLDGTRDDCPNPERKVALV